jgi:hypothetical protein
LNSKQLDAGLQVAVSGSYRNDELAWPRKTIRPLKLAKFMLDLLPGRLPFGFCKASQQLVQRSERLLLETDTFSRR